MLHACKEKKVSAHSFLSPLSFFLVDESNKQQVLVYFRTGCIQKQDRILKNPQEGVCVVRMRVCVCGDATQNNTDVMTKTAISGLNSQ